MTVYFNMTDASRKLDATRQLSETAREITERIANDIGTSGVDDATGYSFDTNYPLWKKYDYTNSGSEFLKIQ